MEPNITSQTAARNDPGGQHPQQPGSLPGCTRGGRHIPKNDAVWIAGRNRNGSHFGLSGGGRGIVVGLGVWSGRVEAVGRRLDECGVAVGEDFEGGIVPGLDARLGKEASQENQN